MEQTYQICKEKLTQVLKLFQKAEKQSTFNFNLLRQNYLMAKSNAEIIRKENYKLISLINKNEKSSKYQQVKQQHIKEDIYHDQMPYNDGATYVNL